MSGIWAMHLHVNSIIRHRLCFRKDIEMQLALQIVT